MCYSVGVNYPSSYHVGFLIVYSLLKALRWHPLQWDWGYTYYTGVYSELVHFLGQTKISHLDSIVTTHPMKNMYDWAQ